MWIRKQYKACRGIALALVITMVLPMVSYAFEPTHLPVSASQEKEFLKLFEENQKIILSKIQNQTDTDQDGAMVWIYIDPKIPDVRFMMKQNDQQTFDLFAQEKKYAKKVITGESYTRHIINRNQFTWVNKFQGHRIGIVDYKGSIPYLVKAELTSANIDQNLLNARVSYTSLNGTQYNQNGQVTFSPQAYKKQMDEQARIQRFYAVADQCAAVVKDDDIRQRDLIRKVFAIQKPRGQYTDEQLEKFEDEIEIAKFAQSSLNVLSEKTLDVSLDTTLYTWMAFHELYFGKKTKEEWIKDFFDIKKHPERTWSSKKYQSAVGNMVAQFDVYRARKPIKTLSEHDKLLAIALFNNDISALNKKCTEAHDERIKEGENVQMIPDARAMARVLDQIDDDLAKKYQDITNPYIEKIKNSPISALLGSEDFRDVIGNFDIDDCVQDGEGVNEVSIDNVNDAIDDISDMYREKISDVVSSYNDVFKASLLQTYIESFPKAVQVVLGQRLGTYEARVICGLIDDIYDEDAILRWRDRALMGIGLLGGLICGATGIGVPATVAITSGINLATIAGGVEKWNKGNELEDQVSQALITGEIDQETGLNDIQKHESFQTEGIWDVAGTIGMEGLGYAAGKTFRYLVIAKQTRTAKNFFSTKDAKLVEGVDRILNKSQYSPIDPEKALIILHKVAITGNTYEKTKGVFAHSFARQAAINEAKIQLQTLGYVEADVNALMDHLFGFENGMLTQRLNISRTSYPDGTTIDHTQPVSISKPKEVVDRSQVESHIEPKGVTEEFLFDVLEEIDNADEEISKLLKAKKTLLEDHAMQESFLASNSDQFNPKMLEFLDRQIQNIDNMLNPLNDHMIDLTQSLLSAQGIGTDIFTNALGHKQLKLFFTNEHPFYQTIERYLKEINQNANGDIEILSGQNLDFIFDPLQLNITHTTAMVSQTRLTFGISTLNRILGNSLGSTEFHEIIHMYNNVRRHKGIPSKFYDQAFLDAGEDLAKTSPEYAEYFSADEIRAYGDTFKREIDNLVKDADGRLFLSAVSANLQIPLALTRTALKNTKDFFEAIAARVTTLKNGKIKYWREDNYRVIEIKLPDQRRYRKYFVTSEEVHLIDNWSVSVGTDNARLAVTIEKAIQADLLNLNALAYRELIDYQIFNARVLEAQRMYATQQYQGVFAQAYDQKLIEIKESSRLVYAHAKETHPDFAWTVEKLDDENWVNVIQSDDGPASISKTNKPTKANQIQNVSHDLMWLRSRAIQNHPDLDVSKLDEAVSVVQNILNKQEYEKISLLETMDILEEAHFTGESTILNGVMSAEYSKLRAIATARQKLRALGYSEEDAATIINRLASNEVRMLGDAKSILSLYDASNFLKSELNLNVADYFMQFDELNAQYYLIRFSQLIQRVKYQLLRNRFFNYFPNSQSAAYSDLMTKISNATSKEFQLNKKFSNEEVLALIKYFGSVPDEKAYLAVDDIVLRGGEIPEYVYTSRHGVELDLTAELSPAQRSIFTKLQTNISGGRASLYGLTGVQEDIIKNMLANRPMREKQMRFFARANVTQNELNSMRIVTSNRGDTFLWGGDQIFDARPDMNFSYADLKQAVLIFDTKTGFDIPNTSMTEFDHTLLYQKQGYQVYRVEKIDDIDHIYLMDQGVMMKEQDKNVAFFEEVIRDDFSFGDLTPSRDYFNFSLSPSQEKIFDRLRHEIFYLKKYEKIDSNKTLHILYEVKVTGHNAFVAPANSWVPNPEKAQAILAAEKNLIRLGYDLVDAQRLLLELNKNNII